MRIGKKEPQDYAAVCGLYWVGSAWYEVLPATCVTQEEAEAQLVNVCPVYRCARDRGVATAGCALPSPARF
ncbi:MAG: hypothetical protein C4303_00760 [candidate division GAL15 bacterium]